MDKPPYTLTFKLKSARADAISAALAQLQDITADYDQTGETAASVTIEAWREQDIVNVRTAFEVWLHRHMIGITCEVTRKDPGVRPETAQFLRAHGETPMDALLHSLADRVGARVELRRNGVTVARAGHRRRPTERAAQPVGATAGPGRRRRRPCRRSLAA